MNRRLRQLIVATHLFSSLGWAGAVLVFLVLAVIALTNSNETIVRGAYLVMLPAAWCVLVPLAHASLLSGIALSLGTAWGLFRHYWVAMKLVLTAVATAILLVYMGTFRQMAGVAGDASIVLDTVRNVSPALHSVLALIALSAATALAVYKPFGLTPIGARSDAVQGIRIASSASASQSRPWLLAVAVAVSLGTLIMLHLIGLGPQH